MAEREREVEPDLRVFARRLLAFAAIAAAVALALHGLARAVLVRSLDDQDRALAERIDEIDTIIVGDSHAQDLGHRLTAHTFHLASPGESVIGSYYRLRRAIDRKPKRLRQVVLGLGVHSLIESRQARPNEDYWARQIDYRELVPQVADPMPVIAEAVRGQLGFVGEGIDIFRGLRSALRNWRKGTTPRTWEERLARLDRPTNDLTDVSEEAFLIHVRKTVAGHVAYGAALDPVVAGYFERILTLCRDAGVHILVVEMPVTDAYFAEISKHVDVAAHDRFVAGAVARTGAGFLDLRHAFADPTLFADPEHVSLNGRHEVTRRVRAHLAGSDAPAPTETGPSAAD